MAQNNTYFSKKIVLMNVFMTILIVIMHSETPERFGQELSWEANPFIWVVFRFTKIAVPSFFFISALLFYRNCEWKDIPTKLHRRIFSLLIPFLIWNILFTGFYVTLDYIPALANKMNGNSGIHNIQGFISAVIETRFTPLWFVKFLIIYNILSPVILLFIKNKWIGLTAIITLFVGSMHNDWGYFSLFHWLPVYLSGALIGRYLYAPGMNECAPLKALQSSSIIQTLMAVVFFTCLCSAFAPDNKLLFYETIGTLLLWFVTDAIGSGLITKIQIREWMTHTFIIYATHYMIINIIEGTIRAFMPHTALIMNVTFIITPIITIALIAWVAKKISKYSFYKYLSGGRG